MHLIKFSNVINDDDGVNEVIVNAFEISEFYLLPDGNTKIIMRSRGTFTVQKDIVPQLIVTLKTVGNGSFRQIGEGK